MEKRIAIVFLDVIREIYKMRGGKVVNSNFLMLSGAFCLIFKYVAINIYM